MKYKLAILLTAALAGLLALGTFVKEAEADDPVETHSTPPVAIQDIQKAVIEEIPKEIPREVVYQTPDREVWLDALIMCESGGNPGAVNPLDLDGTASYGLLQFKPSTFDMYQKRYGIEGELMDPEAQKSIVRRMMDDDVVRWQNEFPDCVRKLGWPPTRHVICMEDCPLIEV
jgi:hypothetical protein